MFELRLKAEFNYNGCVCVYEQFLTYASDTSKLTSFKKRFVIHLNVMVALVRSLNRWYEFCKSFGSHLGQLISTSDVNIHYESLASKLKTYIVPRWLIQDWNNNQA